ncbi:MAG: 3-deoxy-manno-octulosonate cytidylyltransferase [Bacteroidota bacterium]
MKKIGIIPARYASSRFPGKPLADICGKPMIQHVYEQSLKAGLDVLAVATDDKRIAECVTGFGGLAVMTSPLHNSGTERCFEASHALSSVQEEDIIINIQGDEPFIDPAQILLTASIFTDPEVEIATLVKKITSVDELHDANVVKAITDRFGFAIFFSRLPIPFCRDAENENWLEFHLYLKHIGLYAYRASILKDLVKLGPSPLEQAEKLEQLRWIENGFKIKTALTDSQSISIDTPADLERARELFDEK